MQDGFRLLGSGVLHGTLALSRRRCKLVCRHNVHVALCRIPDIDELHKFGDDMRLRCVLQRHRAICQRVAKSYFGHTMYCNTTLCEEVFCFHSLEDALLWALTVQSALLQEEWPAWLQAVPCARTLWHSHATSSSWQRLCAGPRTSIAINEQRFTRATVLTVRLKPAFLPSSQRQVPYDK